MGKGKGTIYMKFKDLTIELTDKDLNTSVADSGWVVDVLALSLKQWTRNELWENNINYEWDYADYPIKHYNYEKRVVDWLNKHEEELPAELLAEYKKSDTKLLAGAWLALEKPADFDAELENYTAEIEEQAREYFDCPNDHIASELCKEIHEAVDDFQDSSYRSWLYGDRDFVGILSLAEKEYYASDVKFDKDRQALTFYYSAEAVESAWSDWNFYEAQKFSKKAFREKLISEINVNTSIYQHRQSEEARKRREERERVAEYQKQRQLEAEQERKVKLLAMTK